LFIVGLAVLGQPAAAQDDPSVTVTKAVLSINPDTGKITDFKHGFEGGGAPATSSYFYYEFCYPPTGGETPESGGQTVGTFTVGVDGALAGECTRTARGGTAKRTSSLTGQYDKAAGTVTFHLKATSVNTDPKRVWSYSLVVDGPAAPLDGDHASSRAPFSFTCTSSAAAYPCPFASITGTLEASVIFPELTGTADTSDAASSAGESGSGGDGGSSKAGLAGVAAIALALAGGAAYEMKRRRDKQAEEYLKARVAVGSDRSGGHEDALAFGESAGVASPAAPKAYEALAVSQGKQSGKDEPLVKSSEAKGEEDERDAEKRTPADDEGR
jgi:hypothetical protein